jgi:hypothetical protein
MKGLILALVVFSMSAYGAKGFLKGSSISGMNKICSYRVFGSTHTVNIGRNKNCPQSHQFQSTGGFSESTNKSYSQQKVKALLKNSTISGMNKICNYYRFGSKYTMNIKPQQSCPQSNQFRK